MPSISATVTTPDGTCPVTLHTPNGPGPWSGVVMYADAGGVRPTFHEMADTLAGFGYAVLLPDVYYRHGDWQPFYMATAFTDPRGAQPAVRDDRQPDAGHDGRRRRRVLRLPRVTARRWAASGSVCAATAWADASSLIVAGRVPERVAAAGSIHGGGLVTDGPDSPHLLADRMTATVYVGAAENDAVLHARPGRDPR